jgi:hypothetical protein
MSNLDERAALKEVDAALRAWPVARAPVLLAPAIMARVRALAAPKPRFALTWLDLALPMFATLMFAVAAALWFRIPEQQWAYLVAQTRWLGLLFTHQLGLLANNPTVLVITVIAVTAFSAVWLVAREPRFAR